ncbi:AraC family transcriptional regulator [Amycolatopsis sp. FDAARGOS 1241]|uniref:helix-turn-helix transcriptional regulator n=1 Tax=Amycolatopsis sp. FDAARGOS 1241 TaxID=2778070 RepID=UPI0019520EFC|nr:AraC family transcriptional regulator [Amycolatopsis sp. FDAARGOS 1241]QRP48583.1 AraC family transcriptional regulator [Amycolatopsis sp. FDAARGOS 1241]
MPGTDCISPLLQHFRIRTRLFHAGPLCGKVPFAAEPGRGFLHVMRGGELAVSYQLGGPRKWVHLDQPTLLFYPRPMDHSFHHEATGESDFVCASLEFDGGINHPLVRTLPPVVMVPLTEVEPLGPAIEMLFAEVDNDESGNGILVDRLFEVVLIQFCRWMLNRTEELSVPPGLFRGLSDPRLAPCLVAIHEDPGAYWSVATMAAKAGLSRAAFAALFKELVGQTPNDYLTAWRVTVAQERLRAGDSVGRAANALGYSSAAAFSRTFSQRTGLSPRQWLLEASR